MADDRNLVELPDHALTSGLGYSIAELRDAASDHRRQELAELVLNNVNEVLRRYHELRAKVDSYHVE